MFMRLLIGFALGTVLAVAALHFSAVAFGYESVPMYLVRWLLS